MLDYTKGYEALKGMRTLQWKPHLGLVDLDIELEDRTLSLSVTPVQATAIIHFQEKGKKLAFLCNTSIRQFLLSLPVDVNSPPREVLPAAKVNYPQWAG